MAAEDHGPLDGRCLEPAKADPGAESGRGLALVEAFADVWGPLTKGHGVFFRLSWTPKKPLPLPRRSPGAPSPRAPRSPGRTAQAEGPCRDGTVGALARHGRRRPGHRAERNG
ncbi:MAG: hypothetical protein M0026_16585 [Nocardiopsaceae bacterium]|nr:hypothetical protein [Nocardiopsaceae bacterium]